MPRRRPPLAALVLAASIAGLSAGPSAAAGPAPPVAAPPAAAPAPLAIARCIWASLPKATREALTSSGPSIDDIGQATDGLNPSLLDLARSQCPAPTTAAETDQTAAAWTAVLLTNWASAQLDARYGVAPAALEQAWSRVGAAGRAALAADASKPADAARADVAALAADLGVAAPQGRDLLVYWAMAELRLEAADRQGSAAGQSPEGSR